MHWHIATELTQIAEIWDDTGTDKGAAPLLQPKPSDCCAWCIPPKGKYPLLYFVCGSDFPGAANRWVPGGKAKLCVVHKMRLYLSKAVIFISFHMKQPKEELPAALRWSVSVNFVSVIFVFPLTLPSRGYKSSVPVSATNTWNVLAEAPGVVITAQRCIWFSEWFMYSESNRKKIWQVPHL